MLFSLDHPRASYLVRPTPGISCEAVPASEVDRRGHEAALLPSNGAAESFVCCIPLFDGAPRLPERPPGPSVACPTRWRMLPPGGEGLTGDCRVRPLKLVTLPRHTGLAQPARPPSRM